MKKFENAKNLQLALVGLDPPIEILNFDNYSGELVSSEISSGRREGAILTSDKKVLWNGIVQINEGGTFDLCVSPTSSTEKDEVILWKDLPPFFTVFDGGYESLSQENISTLLDDLITFHELVKVRCHFTLNDKHESINGSWGDQENLRTLSEILIDWKYPEKLQPEQLVLLEIELFETVYFVIAINEENDDVGIVLSLTSHFYQQKNRVGRRIPIDPIEINGLKILEVSDFGMKVSSNELSHTGLSEIEVVINNYRLLFAITYSKKVSSEEIQMGLFIQDHSPEARKAWQGFLLKHQYPLLQYRDEMDQQNCWNLLEKSGYFGDAVGTMVKSAKEDVLYEWKYSDSSGPNVGITVLGIDQESKEAIATIGIARASKNAWVAQAAATIDNPKYLAFTESMYSWRTRAILQQVDGEFHLAFFDTEKPFLDRFFRKFYLTRNESEKSYISWSEWFAHYLTSDFVLESNQKVKSLESSATVEMIAKILDESSILQTEFGFELHARKHLHIAQLLSSIWNVTDDFSQYLNGCKAYFSEGHRFILVMNKFGFDPRLESRMGVVKYTKKTVWTCHRVLQPKFLQNSLKSLEIMNRKYGRKVVA